MHDDVSDWNSVVKIRQLSDGVIDIDDDDERVVAVVVVIVVVVIVVVVVVIGDVSNRFEQETCNGCSLDIINQKPFRVITSFDLNVNSVGEVNAKRELMSVYDRRASSHSRIDYQFADGHVSIDSSHRVLRDRSLRISLPTDSFEFDRNNSRNSRIRSDNGGCGEISDVPSSSNLWLTSMRWYSVHRRRDWDLEDKNNPRPYNRCIDCLEEEQDKDISFHCLFIQTICWQVLLVELM